MKKPCILFLCGRNASSSQMAEAFAQKYAGRRLSACSAGVSPTQVHPLTCAVMAEVGIELNGHRAKHVKEVAPSARIQQVVVVGDDVEDHQIPEVWSAVPRVRWGLADPAPGKKGKGDLIHQFRSLRDQVDWRVMAWLAERVEA